MVDVENIFRSKLKEAFASVSGSSKKRKAESEAVSSPERPDKKKKKRKKGNKVRAAPVTAEAPEPSLPATEYKPTK